MLVVRLGVSARIGFFCLVIWIVGYFIFRFFFVFYGIVRVELGGKGGGR